MNMYAFTKMLWFYVLLVPDTDIFSHMFENTLI